MNEFIYLLGHRRGRNFEDSRGRGEPQEEQASLPPSRVPWVALYTRSHC